MFPGTSKGLINFTKEYVMFEITPNGENRLDLHISGKIDSETMERGLEEYIGKSEGIENGVMLYTIDDIDVPTLGAIGVLMSKLFITSLNNLIEAKHISADRVQVFEVNFADKVTLSITHLTDDITPGVYYHGVAI